MKRINKHVTDRLLLVGILALPLLLASKNIDNDLWFLLNSGRYILTKGFTNIEPFSMHENLNFSFQQWLTDVYFWKLFEFGGQKLLIAVIIVESSVMLLLFYKLCRTVSDNLYTNYICTALFAAFSSFYMVTRPQITTNIVLITELLCLEKFVRENNRKYLYILPVLSVLEINLHAASWIMIFIFMLPYLCEFNPEKITSIHFKRIAKKDRYQKIPIVCALICSALCGFLNPYGIKNMCYIFNTLGNKYSSAIAEMQNMTCRSFAFFTFMFILLLILIYFLRNFVQIRLRYIYFLFGTGLMSVISVRYVILFSIVGCFICADILKELEINKFSVRNFILLWFTALFVLTNVKVSPAETYDNEHLRIISYIQENSTKEEITLYTDYNSGGIYEFYGYRCYMDARMEVFTKKMNHSYDYYAEWCQLNYNEVYYKDILDKYNFDYYVLSKSSSLYMNMSHDNKYVLVYETENYVLFR